MKCMKSSSILAATLVAITCSDANADFLTCLKEGEKSLFAAVSKDTPALFLQGISATEIYSMLGVEYFDLNFRDIKMSACKKIEQIKSEDSDAATVFRCDDSVVFTSRKIPEKIKNDLVFQGRQYSVNYGGGDRYKVAPLSENTNSADIFCFSNPNQDDLGSYVYEEYLKRKSDMGESIGEFSPEKFIERYVVVGNKKEK